MRKIKIGVVTWNGSYNYGTNLQAYALCKFLEKSNCQVDFLVPIIPAVAKQDFITQSKFFILKIMAQLGIKKDKRLIQFLKLRKYIKNNFNYICWSTLSIQEQSSYDLVLTGSDQIWNPNYFQEFNYLSFVPSDIKKYSYASSIGVNEINETAKLNYQRFLIDFEKISVREKEGAEILAKCLNKDITVVPDPTFLLSQYEWRNIASHQYCSPPYSLFYFIGNNKDNWEQAISMAKKNSKQPLLFIKSLEAKYTPRNLNLKCIDNIGPLEFVSLISNASSIYTDSFHGIVFSIIFNKEFFCFKRFTDKQNDSQNSRIYNLLQTFELTDRIVQPGKKLFQIVNWSNINLKIKEEQNKGISFITKILESK